MPRQALLILWSLLAISCAPSPPPTSALTQARLATPPRLILWAWDRYEDLRFLKPGEAEVAGLLATIRMKDGKADVRFRSLPLLLQEGAPLIAVIRLQPEGGPLPAPASVANWFDILKHRSQPASVQIDFDARESEREWYLELLRELRRWFPKISITALSSWCLQDQTWLAPHRGQEFNEVVPMLFRIGPQRPSLLRAIRQRGRVAEACQGALGVSTDEPLPWYPAAGRIYVFSPHAWTRKDFDEACARWR